MKRPTQAEIEAHFRRVDPILFAVIARVGPCQLKPHRDRFKTLVGSIISQQISTAAARTIKARLEALLLPQSTTPESIAELSLEQLRSVGVSQQKAGYLLDLAEKCSTGQVQLSQLGRLSDECIIEQLVQVKGIGRWSAQMFLMFSLARLDVFPYDDLGIKNAIQAMYGFKQTPTKSELIAIGDEWSPYATIGSWYCWRSPKPPRSLTTASTNPGVDSRRARASHVESGGAWFPSG